MNKILILTCIIASVILSACGSNNDGSDDPNGPKKVALLVELPQDTSLDLLRPFVEGPMSEYLAEYGYIQGENVELTTILSGDESDLTAQLVGYDAIYAAGLDALKKALNTGHNIPTVFFFDDIEFQTDEALREQIQQPDSVVTGVLTPNVAGKRFSLLMEIDPSIERIFMPYNPETLTSREMLETVENIAEHYDVTVVPYEYTDPQSAQRSFREIPDDVDAILIGSDSFMASDIEGNSLLALQNGTPFANGLPIGLQQTLLSYGANLNDGQRIVARFIAQILDGTQPADLPIEYVDPQLIISLGAADVLGLEIPTEVLQQADVIVRGEIVLAEPVDVAAGFCNATLESLLGTTQACITVACDSLEDTSQASYIDREETDTCTAEGSLGVCRADDRDVIFYDGDAALLQTGCQLGGGIWVEAED